MSVLRAVILAAGEGTRMKSDLPKVLHPICGRPMISYALSLAAASGVKQPIVVVGAGADEVRKALPKEVKVVTQSHRLGTADAVLVTKRAFGGLIGDILILYGDTPLLRRSSVQHLIEAHHKSGATCTLLSTHLADPSGYGRIVREPTGRIVGILEETEANAAHRSIREINAGPMVCKAQALFDALAEVRPTGNRKEMFLTHVVTQLAKKDDAKIHSIRVEETLEALGINSRADLARATGVVRQRILETHLRGGVTIEDPTTTFIEQGVSIGRDTVIRPHTVIETGTSIGRRCIVGPFARLRAGVSIADDARIGNFVELVRTRIGNRVRVSHVAYLGDTTVDEDSNIGAGTVTANYDGKKKHATHIGKGAFIGSDTVLIAPITVGPGARTGAGSVVPSNHDIPRGCTVMGVPARIVENTHDGKASVPVAKSKKTAKRAVKAKPSKNRGKIKKKSEVRVKQPAR